MICEQQSAQFFCNLFDDLMCSENQLSSFLPSGNSLGTDMLTEHPLLSEPSSVSFYNWMSNAVGNRSGAGVQDSPVNRSQHNSLQTGETRWTQGFTWRVVAFFFFTSELKYFFYNAVRIDTAHQNFHTSSILVAITAKEFSYISV